MSRTTYSWLLTALLLGSSVMTAGCSKKEKSKDTAASAAAGKAEKKESLASEIQALATTCEVMVPSSGLKCKNGEQRKLVAELSRDKSRAKSLQALVSALRDKDQKVQTVAANLLHLAFRSSLGNDAKKDDVPAEVAKSLIEAVGHLPKPQAAQAVPAAVHAAMLSGQQEALFKMLDGRAADKLPAVGYRYLMTHGRLAAFDKVKALVASDQLDAALAAAASPSSMRDWTADEEAQICPWAKDLLGDERVGLATRAASLLGHCSGEYVDTLLKKGEELLKAGKLTQAQITPFRDVCSSSRRRVKPDEQPKVTDDQCKRNRAFLEKVLSNKSVDARTKSMVLSALTYQWPDDATLKLVKKFEKDPDQELAKRASEMAKRLERRGSKPVGSASPAPVTAPSAAGATAAPRASGVSLKPAASASP